MSNQESIQRLRTRRGRAIADRALIVDQARRERRDGDTLTEVEDKEFRLKTEQIGEFEARIDELEDADRRQRHANAATARSGAGWYGGDRGTYAPDSGQSYYATWLAWPAGWPTLKPATGSRCTAWNSVT